MTALLLLGALLWYPAASGAPATKPTPALSVLQGTVQGPEARPIENALVIARARGARMSDPPRTSRTDAAGKFRIPLNSKGLVDVRVEAAGLAPRSFASIRPSVPLAVVLQKGGIIEGIVRDGASSRPVPGARVEARPDGGLLGSGWEPNAGLVEATTDTKGHFRLDGLGSGVHTVSAAGRGYGRTTRPSVPPGGRVDLFLFPGAAIRGVVKGPQNQPLPRVMVRVEGGPRLSAGSRVPSTSDASGRFEFLGMEPGVYSLVAHHSDWALGVFGDIRVTRQGDVDAELRLEPGRRISGRLVDADQRPVPGRVAVHVIAGQSSLRSVADLLRAEAGADGRFSIDRLPAGDHALAVDARGYGVMSVDVQVRSGDREVSLGDVTLETGMVIRGRVRDRAGLGIASAEIVGQPAGVMRSEGRVETIAAPDGAFVLAGLEGSYRLRVSAPGYANATVTAAPGTDKLDLVLEPAGSITGIVMDEAGRTVESFQARAIPTRRGPGPSMTSAFGDAGPGDGRFTVPDLATGEYVVEVTAPNKGRGLVSAVKVTAGAPTDVGRVTLKAGGIVRGQVVDSGGAPVAGANVMAGPSESVSSPDQAAGSTDASGTFEIRGVPLGLATATATHPNFAVGQAAGLQVNAAQPAETRIVLTQGGRVGGTARRRGNLAIADAQIEAILEDGRMPVMPTMTEPDGSFTLEHVPPGRVRVMLMEREGAAVITAQSREVMVHEGRTSVVDFLSREIRLSGTVTRGGGPLSGVRLRLLHSAGGAAASHGGPGPNASAEGPHRMTAVSREDGSYEMLVDEPGSFEVHFESTDGRILPGRMVEVPDTDVFTSDYAFSGIIVSGVVIDKETEQAVANAQVYLRSRAEGAGPGPRATTGPDGGFQVEVDVGEYSALVRAEGYKLTSERLSVSLSGASDLRLVLARALPPAE